MSFHSIYKSVFAILRVDTSITANNAIVAGSGFVVGLSPLRILTCNHVVGEGTKTNDGVIRYSITKRSDASDEFDLRTVEISFLSVKTISRWPELDLAILEIDPTISTDVATKLRIAESPALVLGFDKSQREPGRDVSWLSTAGAGDLTLTPRLFKGHLVASYKTNHQYNYRSAGGDKNQLMTGIDMIEVDKLFIPGVSGSPIIDAASSTVIGFVHGFRSWPIPTATEIQHQVELTEGGKVRPASIKYNLPLTTSLSLGIDTRSIEAVLRKQGLI